MKRVVAGVIVLAALYLLVFGGSSSKTLPSQKVTIEIATPNGAVTGSSVFELTHSTAPWWYPSAVKSATGIKGEAPYVDLGDGRYVFMLLHDQFFGNGMMSYLVSERPRGNIRPPYDRTPIFVTFDNIADANSVRLLDRNALDRTFGPGYRLVDLTVTDTKERATQGTLAAKFPALHAALMRPSAERIPKDALSESRLDLRRITWMSFDSVLKP